MSGEELQQELKRIVSSQSLHIIHIWGQYGVKATAEDSADDFYHALVLLEEEYSDSDGDIGRKSSRDYADVFCETLKKTSLTINKKSSFALRW